MESLVLLYSCAITSGCDAGGVGVAEDPLPMIRADVAWRVGPVPADRVVLDPTSDVDVELFDDDVIDLDRYVVAAGGAWVPLEELPVELDELESLTVEAEAKERGFREYLECVVIVTETKCVQICAPPRHEGPGSSGPLQE